MAEEEIVDDSNAEDLANETKKEGRSNLFRFLFKFFNIIIAFIVGIFLVFIISYFVTKNVRFSQYQELENITTPPPPAPLATFAFPKEFKVNTADTEEQYFIKLTLQLAYDAENISLSEELSNRQAQMSHIINIILSSKKREDLASLNQKIDLSEEIKLQLNLVLSSGKIKERYFIEFLLG